jgi:hypothetical protein
MIEWYRRWRERLEAGRNAREAAAPFQQRALAAFSAAYPTRRITDVTSTRPCSDGYVAIIHYATGMRPAPSTYWLVTDDGVREIDRDQAAARIHIPVRR